MSRGQATVPNVVNTKQAAAQKALEDEGFKVSVQEDPAATQEQGIVSDQSLSSGQRVPRGTSITITVSSRPDEPEVADGIADQDNGAGE